MVSIRAIDPTAASWLIEGTSGTTTGAFEVYRLGDLEDPITVSYTVGGTAGPGVDYEVLPEYVTIPANEYHVGILVKAIVQPVNDTVGVTVALSPSPNDYILGDPGPYTVGITHQYSQFNPPPDGGEPLVPSVQTRNIDPNSAELPGQEQSTGAAILVRAVPEFGPIYDVTIGYTVGGTATNGIDYQPLSGSVTIPADTYVAPIVLTPIDDLLVEGPETVNVTEIPSDEYYGASSVTLGIGDDEHNNLSGVPDEYAMSASAPNLSVSAKGVLCNDTYYSETTPTATLTKQASQGTVVLNADGSLVYTPNDALRATGGMDSFTYAPMLNGVMGLGAAVSISVVKISLTIGNGNFIPYNANDTNGSPQTDGVPVVRDLSVNEPFRSWQAGDTTMPTGPAINDTDLVSATVTVTGWMPTGTIIWTVTTVPGGGQIRFWTDQQKTAQLPVNVTGPSFTFYIEGSENSAALNDVRIDFWYEIQPSCQPAVDVDAPAIVTVTPVVNSFTVTPKSPPDVTLGKDGLGRIIGMNSGQQSMDGAPPNSGAKGATFASSVNQSGVGGDKFYVQNMMDVINAAGGGLVFTAASGLTPLSLKPTGEALPLLDKVDTELPPPPDYTADTDTPFIQHPNFQFAQTVDIKLNLKLFLMFRYAADHSIDSLAYIEWHVYFKAARNTNGDLIIDTDSKTTSETFVRSHDLPTKLNSPTKTTFNNGMAFQAP